MADSQPAAFMPGSRYAAALSKGARDMRFPPELEREYHRFYLAERRSHVFESEYAVLSTGKFKSR